MAANEPDTPSYLSPSPVGFHITDLQAFVRSSYLAPVSQDPDKADWATEATASQFSQTVPKSPAGDAALQLVIINKSRDTDRICPSCRRWYKFGEPERHYQSFSDFLKRNISNGPAMSAEQREEQDLSGICSQICMDALVEDPEETDKNHGMEIRRLGSWLQKRTTRAKEAQTGAKIVWERIIGA
ncbi:hypothetical protein G7Y79_00010g029200 [Physcia stellaris]|nr:hypothetical protein G7Y79_00010g029200 [Physcia stellaris]